MAAGPVRNRPCVLIIRDGWGENPDSAWDHANAVRCADPPVDARLLGKYLSRMTDEGLLSPPGTANA